MRAEFSVPGAERGLGHRLGLGAVRVLNTLRPRMGWVTFLLMLLLQVSLTAALRQTRWVDFGTVHLPPELISVMGMLFVWWLVRPATRDAQARRPVVRAWWLLVLAILGSALWLQQMTNMVGRWLQWRPEGLARPEAYLADLAAFFTRQSAESLNPLLSRIDFWVQGVRGAGAQQDDLILVGLISIVLFVLAVQSCWMFMTGHSILACMVPSLWVYAWILFYSHGPRASLVLYLVLLFLLFAWRQHEALLAQWRHQRIDYPESLLLDRAAALVGGLVFMAVMALVLPSIQLDRVVDWASDIFWPVDEATTDLGERMFPDLQPRFRGRSHSAAGGLPNSFLLGNAPDLSTSVVMRVMSNYPFAGERGFYMRGMTFRHYDGRGWSNADVRRGDTLRANSAMEPPVYPHTRDIWQSIEMYANASVIYAIPEPIQFSVDVRPDLNPAHEVILYRNAERRAYTALSAMPMLSADILSAVPMTAYQTLAEDGDLADFLQLSDTITDRTRALAERLTAGLDTPYAMGLAVERHLRTYPYDLEVSLPQGDVADVADYFLFELQRGYCDYYTTAFVVLMRSLGMPARFAVGYAPGYYDTYTEDWTITDAQAHAWPEVWFPGLGWIPFEPTAGRSELARDFVPVDLSAPDPTRERAAVPDVLTPRTAWTLDPQMLFWLVLLMLGAGGAVIYRWQTVRDPDPWYALLVWGRRLGRAKRPWETEWEYAGGLGQVLQNRPRLAAEEQRVIRGQLHQLTAAVVRRKYALTAPDAQDSQAVDRLWSHLRRRLRRIWVLRM